MTGTEIERKSLREAGRTLVRDWLSYGHRSGPEVLENIRRMLREVKTAVNKYVTARQEPETARWHDNQCVLFSLLRQYRSL